MSLPTPLRRFATTWVRNLLPLVSCGIILLIPGASSGQNLSERSANFGGHPQAVAFVNQTNENVVVHWIDFDGVGHEIGVMVPSQVAEITTYPGHLTTFSTGSRRVATFRASTLSESAYAIAGPGGGSVNPGPSPGTGGVAISSKDFGGQAHVTRQVTLNRGDSLTVDLESNPSTGFSWGEQAMITDLSVVRQVKHEMRGPAVSMPGAPGTEVWTFGALGPGVCSLSFAYSRAWAGGEKGVRTLNVTVTVR